jgi:L-aspartate oxidase
MAASDGLADPEAVRILTSEGPDRIYELLAIGAVFDRGADGKLGLGLEAAHTQPRIIHSGGDRTGAALISCLAEVVRSLPEIEILEHTEVTSLLAHEDGIRGVAVLPQGGTGSLLPAPAVVLATGGVGQLYAVTTNPKVATADGWALADRAGAQLRDIEFLQFHPTALKLPGVNPAPLISEAVRGAGAVLVDRSGKRFALDHDARGELAPRDVVARAVAAADAAGGAWLDARTVEDFENRFPGITAILKRVGLDAAFDPIPVAPALHYAMGGIETDLEGRTSLPGLWAVGEVARTGVHGANRLASNSLLEGLVFADRAGRALTEALRDASSPPLAQSDFLATDIGADLGCEPIRAEMRSIMTADVGLQRSEASLLHAERELERLTGVTPPLAWRTHNQLLVAGLITHAARGRRESRGGHRRTDYPPPSRRREAV